MRQILNNSGNAVLLYPEQVVPLPLGSDVGYYMDGSPPSAQGEDPLTDLQTYLGDNGVSINNGNLFLGMTVADAIDDIEDFAFDQLAQGDLHPIIVIVGHGDPGTVDFGWGTNGTNHPGSYFKYNDQASASDLNSFISALQQIAPGYILFTGCQIGAGTGQALLTQIAQGTGSFTFAYNQNTASSPTKGLFVALGSSQYALVSGSPF